MLVSTQIASYLLNTQHYKVSVRTAVNCRFSHTSLFSTWSQNSRKGPFKLLPCLPKPCVPTWCYPRDALGLDFKGFFSRLHWNWLPSPSMNGMWTAGTAAASWTSPIYDRSSFKYLPAVKNKTGKEKESVSQWLWIRCSCSKYIARSCDVGNALWCHKSSLCCLEFDRPGARWCLRQEFSFCWAVQLLEFLCCCRTCRVWHFVARHLLGRVLVSKLAFIFNSPLHSLPVIWPLQILIFPSLCKEVSFFHSINLIKMRSLS